jgi:hypothetical protein
MVINFKLKNMKQILLLAVLALGINVSAQITKVEEPEFIEVYRATMGVHSISKSINEDSTWSYFLVYRDMQYEQITSFESLVFSSKEDVIDFFNVVKDVIATKEKNTIEFNGQIVRFLYILGKAYMYVGNCEHVWTTKGADKCIEALQ